MKRIVFMGTPDFSVPILKQLIQSEYEVVLVVTQPDRPKGRKKIITPPPVKETAVEYGIPVFQPEKIRHDYQEILDYEPDLVVTAAYGQILPNELLEGPTFGCINVHASLLPELRGGAPIHYSIIQGKDETGITIMYMAEKLDAGDILTQRSIPIEETDHVGTLHDKLSKVGAELLMETLPQLFEGKITPIKQDDSKATFASNIKREQEEIDWNKSNRDIYNHIRGLHPWPVAFTTYENKNVKIWWGEPIDKEYNGVPGEIVDKEGNESIIVLCGNGKGIRLTDIQLAGKRRMKVKEYLQGASDSFQIGTKMGE
ncbi:methionyl-tRNA formyltransferase [Ornithinibacillus halotolerans]|uniref:Methionyl-tRNA formyltransferase n=1 Tax=Ornithinibacillus halotolerans TaxID=1274357 RepID=A0A916WBT9_9BACI|nr:methionyl-tRNA formyltransferase [Ornithinibacillus halotolerans]GGA84184.1 methionyl-tRNA formyltransferase [Ornithinibacillus halotolerans]